MSKDQLSWEQLFSQQIGDASDPSSDPSDQTKDQQAENQRAETPTEPLSATAGPKKKRATRKKKTSVIAVEEKTTLYSKKDWGRLEIPVAAKTEQTVAVVQTETEVDDLSVLESAEPAVITVSQLNKHIRELLEGQFSTLWLKGEISNFKAHTSGHFYFSLKDAKAQISAVMFRGYNSQLRFRPEDGMEVLVRGKITVYEPRGNYQIFCESMEPVGAGALQKAFEQLKAKLQKEGLFDEARKRPLPALPKHIAIVTSPTGAAIRDMLNVLGRRFKGADITIVPCKVQGDQAPREIVEAINLACLLPDIDVMIVGRGGGSIEDLWAFNDERVARAIAGARVPVISAVGHEVDFTIADFVADLRAPTPSAAAELVVKSAADLLERVRSRSRGLRLAMLGILQGAKQHALHFGKRLVDPQRRIQDASMRCDELLQRLQQAAARELKARRTRIGHLEEKLGTPIPRINQKREATKTFDLRLRNGIKALLTNKKNSVGKQMAVLDSLSPLRVLDRGYSMVVANGEIVTNAKTLAIGQSVTVRMCNGSIDAQVTKIEEER